MKNREKLLFTLVCIGITNGANTFDSFEAAKRAAEATEVDEGNIIYYIIDRNTDKIVAIGKPREQVTRVDWSS